MQKGFKQVILRGNAIDLAAGGSLRQNLHQQNTGAAWPFHGACGQAPLTDSHFLNKVKKPGREA